MPDIATSLRQPFPADRPSLDLRAVKLRHPGAYRLDNFEGDFETGQ